MTIRIEYSAQTAIANQRLNFPAQDAGSVPTRWTVTLRNVGPFQITVTKIGGTSGGSRFNGWFMREDATPPVPLTLAPNATTTFQWAVFGRENGEVLEAGSYTGGIHITWYVTAAGPGSAVTSTIFTTAIVRDTALPDLRVTKAALFSDWVYLHVPCGSQTRTADNPFGLNSLIVSSGYQEFFADRVAGFIPWVGTPARFFLDRVCGNDLLSSNSGDVPFDGIIDLQERQTAALATAANTFYDGMTYLGNLPCSTFIYQGSLANDTNFSSLADNSDWPGLYARMHASIYPYLAMPNLVGMAFDDPFGLSDTDARTRIYTYLRKVLQARGCQVLQEPRATNTETVFTPENGWGTCIAWHYWQRTDPRWGNGPNGWSPWTTQMPTARLTNVPIILWSNGVDYQLIAAQIAACIVDTHTEGRTLPIQYATNFRPYRLAGLSTDNLVSDVNSILATITGDS